MISAGIYTITLSLMILVLASTAIRLKSKQIAIIGKKRANISRLIDQKILKFDQQFDSYTDRTKQWQEDFNDKIIELKFQHEECSKKRITFSNFNQLDMEIENLLLETEILIESEKQIHNYKNEVKQFISNLRLLLIENENNATLRSEIELLTEMLRTDPINAYEIICSIPKKKKVRKA